MLNEREENFCSNIHEGGEVDEIWYPGLGAGLG